MTDMTENKEGYNPFEYYNKPEEERELDVEAHEPVGAIPIQTVRPRHNAIMDFILANPTVPMGTVAAHFRVSASWLSIIIHSDCFEAQMREKQELMFSEMLIPLGEKLTGVAHLAIEKLGRKIEESEDASYVLDATDKVLSKLGFGARSVGAIQINTGPGTNVAVVNSAILNAARERMLAKASQQGESPPLPFIEGDSDGTEVE